MGDQSHSPRSPAQYHPMAPLSSPPVPYGRCWRILLPCGQALRCLVPSHFGSVLTVNCTTTTGLDSPPRSCLCSFWEGLAPLPYNCWLLPSWPPSAWYGVSTMSLSLASLMVLQMTKLLRCAICYAHSSRRRVWCPRCRQSRALPSCVPQRCWVTEAGMCKPCYLWEILHTLLLLLVPVIAPLAIIGFLF